MEHNSSGFLVWVVKTMSDSLAEGFWEGGLQWILIRLWNVMRVLLMSTYIGICFSFHVLQG